VPVQRLVLQARG